MKNVQHNVGCPPGATSVPSPTRKGFSLKGFIFLISIHFIKNGKGRKLFRTRSHQNNKIAHGTTEENFSAPKEERS